MGVAEDDIRKHTTPAYRAPEQWDLYARQFIGTPVDVWALGCLLYFLCSGKLPFDGDAKLQILTGRYQRLDRLHPDVSALIAACLRVAPRERPSAGALVSAVSEIRQGGDSTTIAALLAPPKDATATSAAPAPTSSETSASPPVAPASPAVVAATTSVALAAAAAVAAPGRSASGGVPVELVAPGGAAPAVASPATSAVTVVQPSQVSGSRPSALSERTSPSLSVADVSPSPGASFADLAVGADDAPLVALPPDDVREGTPPSLLDAGAEQGFAATTVAAADAGGDWASFSSVPVPEVVTPQVDAAAAFESSGWEAFGDASMAAVSAAQQSGQPGAAFSQDGEWSSIGAPASVAVESDRPQAFAAEQKKTKDASGSIPGAAPSKAASSSSTSSERSRATTASRGTELRTRVEELEERCRGLESQVEVRAARQDGAPAGETALQKREETGRLHAKKRETPRHVRRSSSNAGGRWECVFASFASFFFLFAFFVDGSKRLPQLALIRFLRWFSWKRWQ